MKQTRNDQDDQHTPGSDDNDRLKRWRAEAEFEDDIRSVMQQLRPHRAERLAGWSEYSAKGEHFRVTVSWEPSGDPDPLKQKSLFQIPDIAEVLETLLVGSARAQDELDAKEEFELYAMVVNDLSERLKEMRARYD